MDRAWSPLVLQTLAAKIRDHAGLSFLPERYDELERRTRRAMAKVGITDVRDYTDGLGSGRLSFDDWISELTVGETYFFREPAHFEFIRTRILPGLLAARGMGHVFRVWSAGCASGEEAYSLAILFEEQCLSATLHLVATDVSRCALAKARRALYGAWSMRGASDDWIEQYFSRRENKQFELADRLRRQVTFEYLNLALDEYPSFFTGVWGNDIILCRNVMIYLHRETVRAVARRLFESLADGGWLITGPSDPPLGDYAPFETVLSPFGVFYRRAARAAMAFQSGDAFATTSTAPASAREAAKTAPPKPYDGSRVDGAGWDEETTGVRVGVSSDSRGRPTSSEKREQGASRGGETGPNEASTSFELASAAFAAGQYRRALELARKVDDARAAALEVKATANFIGAREAARVCTAALLRFPLSAELYVLETSLLLDLGDYDGALRAARRLLYLDRSLVIAHLLLGSILGKRGDRAEATRAFGNARDLAGSSPADDLVPFADGERAGRLADFARAQIELLGADSARERHAQ